MSNTTIEAILKISAKLGNLQALRTLERQLGRIDNQAKAYNRSQAAIMKAGNAAYMASARFIAPAAAIYGGARAVTAFAEQERALTRTGLKIGATRQEMQGLLSDAEKSARKVGLLTTDVIGTIDSYAETGASLRDIRNDLGTLTEAQQALGADGRDIVNVWDAARKSFGLMSQDAKRFYGSIGAGGAAGKFEGSDMAQYFPSLLPSAANFGMKGMQGVDQLVAFAEVMRDFVGTSSEAATSVGDFLEKVNSPDVQRNFQRFGINLEQRMKKAREHGDDMLQTMHKLLVEATKGDPTKLAKLFGDKEARRAARVILEEFDKIRAAQDEIARNAPSVIDKNNAELLKDARTDLDQLADAYDRLTKSAGKKLVEFGVADAMSGAADNMDKAGVINAQLEKEGKGWVGRRLWWLRNGFDTHDQNLKAIDGGYPIGGLSDLSYPGKFPLITPHDVPIPLARPPRPGEPGYIPSMPSRVSAPEAGFDTPRPPAGQIASGFNAFGAFEERLEQSLSAGGKAIEKGGKAAAEGGKAVAEGGSEAGRALQEGASALRAAAAAITGAIGALNSGAAGRRGVNANVGAQGGDVTEIP